MSEIGDKIKELRESQNLTVQELADRAEIDRSTLLKIEDGTNNPAKRTRTALAKALNNNLGDVDLDKYLNGDDLRPSKKDIVKDMSLKEFVGIKFEGKSTRRRKAEIEMLTKLLDAELARND